MLHIMPNFRSETLGALKQIRFQLLSNKRGTLRHKNLTKNKWITLFSTSANEIAITVFSPPTTLPLPLCFPSHSLAPTVFSPPAPHPIVYIYVLLRS